jgi:hypothetical protein
MFLQIANDYYLTMPDGDIAVISPNNQLQNWCALPSALQTAVRLTNTITDPSGGDGVLISDIYRAERTVVMTVIVAHPIVNIRSQLVAKLLKVHQARTYGRTCTLQWQEADGNWRQISGLRIADWTAIADPDGPNKQLQIQLVTGDPRILGRDGSSIEPGLVSGQEVALDNAGDGDAFPVFTVYGPCDSFTIIKLADTLGNPAQALVFDAPIADGHYIYIDCWLKNCRLDQVTRAEGSLAASDVQNYLSIQPSGATVAFQAVNGGADTKLRIDWSDTWD